MNPHSTQPQDLDQTVPESETEYRHSERRKWGYGNVGIGVLFVFALLATWYLFRTPRHRSAPPSRPDGESLLARIQGDASASQPLTTVQYRRKGGFDVRNAIVPVNEIRSGGPPKDGIPALTSPKVIAGAMASYLRPNDRVIGYSGQSQSRAYPLKILNQHEIVNDRVEQIPIAVTYCPLCDSAVIFDRRAGSGELEFGVSGLLFNSNVLMYDRRSPSASLWSQLMTGSVSGPAVGKRLATLPVELTTWQDWLTRNPRTTVLSPETGYQRDYSRNPYARYFSRPQLMFPVRPSSNLLPPKTAILGVWTDRAARAYIISTFGRAPRQVTDRLDGHSIKLQFTPQANQLRVIESDEGVSWMYSFWFAWYAFRPQTDIFKTP